MEQGIVNHNWMDGAGKPAGGTSYGSGLCISWQNGPLGRGEDRQASNGAFVEDVIEAARQRIAFYQEGEFACGENACALDCLSNAMIALNERTGRRESEGTEGTYKGT